MTYNIYICVCVKLCVCVNVSTRISMRILCGHLNIIYHILCVYMLYHHLIHRFTSTSVSSLHPISKRPANHFRHFHALPISSNRSMSYPSSPSHFPLMSNVHPFSHILPYFPSPGRLGASPAPCRRCLCLRQSGL